MRRIRVFLAVSVVAVMPALMPAPAQGAFPAKNGLIAFAADTGNGYQLYTVRPNGHDLRRITSGPDQASTPDWSPDGQWLAFSLNECEIGFIHPDGTDQRVIPSQTPGGCETDPAFTPDGTHVVFERYDPATDDDAIWIMDLNGDGRRRLGAAPGDGGATPEVSPDGQTVTFLAGTSNGLTALFAVDIDGGDVWQVTPTLYGITFKHDWAPDGSRLVMSDNADDASRPANVVTFRSDGSGLQYLTDLQAPGQNALAGGYSPNGKWITYRLEHGDLSALMIMRTDGQGDHAILRFSSLKPRFIDWGPATK
jgi:Tol biopolymer transport system component